MTPEQTQEKIAELRERLRELSTQAEDDAGLASKVIALEEEIRALEAAAGVRKKLLKG